MAAKRTFVPYNQLCSFG